ncbi:unnamed protein product [Linum tenue]|uniref:F-box domain-containing protein n=1 Tax=Linum tenue TaxID=586396 RepID=A0AAV0R5C8_9ROSI|nr:unnamed protein product [Linum tenue]
MKRVYQSSADRITNLPADVIQRILVSLPIKDAAKTSILSSKWRHNWKSIPQLVFDGRFARINRVSESQSDLRSKLVMLNIYKALLVHDGPITKFVLSIPGLNFCDVIDHIVLYFSNKGVQDFTLIERSTDDYQMHSSLFSALHLKSLKLRSCELMPPYWFDGFSKLTHLRLGEVTLPSDFFENFLTKCPVLEYLRVVDCEGPAVELEIVAPCLKSFHYAGSLRVISFKCTPLLSCVALYTCDTETHVVALFLYETDTHDMAALFASIPTIQKFCANGGFLKTAGHRNVPSRLPSPLHQLQFLETIELDFDSLEWEHGFVCLIMGSPNLRRLKIEYHSMLEDQPTKNEVSNIRRLLEAEGCSGSSNCLQHLKEFIIWDSYGTQVELDIVRFVLATAPLLRLVHIKAAHNLSSKTVMKFSMEALRYKRVSKEAEFIYPWVDKDV